MVGINIYRTIQEAVNNAVKYSDGNEISVNIYKNNHKIKIAVINNGNGFDLEKTSFGNGLYNMKKRIEEIGGTFEIKSNNTTGTIITLLV